MRRTSQYRFTSRPPFIGRASIWQRFRQRILVGIGLSAGAAGSYLLYRRSSQQSSTAADRLVKMGRSSFQKAKEVAPDSPQVQKALDLTIGQAEAAERTLGRTLVGAGNGSRNN